MCVGQERVLRAPVGLSRSTAPLLLLSPPMPHLDNVVSKQRVDALQVAHRQVTQRHTPVLGHLDGCATDVVRLPAGSGKSRRDYVATAGAGESTMVVRQAAWKAER